MEAPQSLKRLTLRPVSARFADAFVIMRDAFIAVSENEWKGGAVIAHTDPTTAQPQNYPYASASLDSPANGTHLEK